MRRTWVVVCDASRARVFQVGPRRNQWQLVRELEHPEGRAKGRDLLSDRPGRTKQSAGVLRPALELPTGPHEVESERFARLIAKLLEGSLMEHLYEQVVLIAPPHFLGLLRSSLSETVAKRVQFTLDKDYTALDTTVLAERLPI
jgi:protein required for attachment to host cells